MMTLPSSFRGSTCALPSILASRILSLELDASKGEEEEDVVVECQASLDENTFYSSYRALIFFVL
jgi:hypothetical protein